MRAWRWWLVAAVAALVVGVAATGGSVQEAAPTASATGDAATLGIDGVETASGQTRVFGWVRAPEPVVVVLTFGDSRLEVAATQRRPDLDVAFGAVGYRGFVFEIDELPASQQLCVEASGVRACRPSGCARSLFDDAAVDRLEERFPDQRVTAHVVDVRTGCVYALEPELRITTASVVKLEILGDLLLDAQRAGRALTAAERRLAEDMMRFSSNDAAASLYSAVGGVVSLTAHSASVGATHTTHTPTFGSTWSTAADRTAVALAVLAGGHDLRAEGRETAWDIMEGVTRAQSWGLSAGLPEGWRVAAKNGFYPYGEYRWRVGSSGFVADPSGGGYAITIMSDGNVVQVDGITLVEEVALHVAEQLAWGAPAARPFDDVDCVTHFAGGSWVGLTTALDRPADAAADVRRSAGGDGPLRGQLVCTP